MLGSIAVGGRIHVGGGYDMNPSWLAASVQGYDGTVIDLLPGRSEHPTIVVELDQELCLPDGAGEARGNEVRGRYLVLRLRYQGASWSEPSPIVQVVLCIDRPSSTPPQEGSPGVWVESHATVRRIRPEGPRPPALPPIGDPSPWP